MEEFFRAVGKLIKDLPTREEVLNKTYTEEQIKARCIELFEAHGMDVLGPPHLVE